MTDIPGSSSDRPFLASFNKYQSLLEAVNGIVWEADAITLEPTFISDSAARILGYTPDEWINTPKFWQNHIYHEDRAAILSFYSDETNRARNHNLNYRMVRADGGIVWIRDIISVVSENGRPRWMRGIMIDITEPKLLADLDRLEKEVLELNARKHTDIETVLNFYVLGIEKLFPQMKCSVLRVTGTRLNNWASPSLPEGYTSVIRDKEIGPHAGSCGAAAYLKQKVIVDDIAHHEVWAAHKEYALAFNLRASWSYPIINSQGEVIATFGIYYDKITVPDESQMAIIERSAEILKIILENRLYAGMMQDANTLISQGQALANFGTWQWDFIADKVTWSDVLYHIYGLDEKTFKATYEGYTERLHPEDRHRVSKVIQDVLATGQDAVFEERIIRPDGQVRYLKSWARLVTGDAGKPEKMIGACLDITKAKTTEMKMGEIAWMQSHVIRAPLARLMGLIDILQADLHPHEEHLDLLNKIIDTSRELDAVIHDISDNTR